MDEFEAKIRAEQQMDDAIFRQHTKKIESRVQPIKVVHKLTKTTRCIQSAREEVL